MTHSLEKSVSSAFHSDPGKYEQDAMLLFPKGSARHSGSLPTSQVTAMGTFDVTDAVSGGRKMVLISQQGVVILGSMALWELEYY